MATTTNADVEYLARLQLELERALGPRVRVESIERSLGPAGIHLEAHCSTPIGAWGVGADGASVIDASARLLRRAVEDRVVLAFRELVTAG
jgi:hypothetical protein